jgi:hypothetical protein
MGRGDGADGAVTPRSFASDDSEWEVVIENDAAMRIQAAVRGAQVRNPRPDGKPGTAAAEQEIERAKAAQILQLKSDAAEAATAIVMQRTKQQDEEIKRLRALVSAREDAFSELRTETEKARERRLRVPRPQRLLPEPEPEPEIEPTTCMGVLSETEGGAGAVGGLRVPQPVRFGSAASAAWAAAAKLDADVAKLSEEERARAEKEAAAKEARQAAESAEEQALARAAAAQKEAAARLASLIETVRLETQEAEEAAARVATRARLEEQAREAAAERKRFAEAEAEATVELAREQAAAAAQLAKDEEQYQAERVAAEEREAAVRAVEEREYEAAQARAVEREIARRAALTMIAGSTGSEQRRHLTHVTMRTGSPRTPSLLITPADEPAGRRSSEGHRRQALQDAEQRLNSLQKQLEAEKSELQKELSKTPEEAKLGKMEGTPPVASFVELQHISQQLDAATAAPAQLRNPSPAHPEAPAAAPSGKSGVPPEAKRRLDMETAEVEVLKDESAAAEVGQTGAEAEPGAEADSEDTEKEAERRRLATEEVQARCKVAITRGRSLISTGAYVTAAAAFEEVAHVFRSYVIGLPQPEECSSERVAMAKLYAQAQPLGLNQDQVDEVLVAFRTIAATLRRHGLSENSVAKAKQLEQQEEGNMRTAAELSAYLTHDPKQQSLSDYRAAVRGLADLEATIAAGEKDAVRQRSEIIETLKAGLVRVEHRAKDQGKAAGIILAEEAQPARAIIKQLEETTSVALPRSLSPPHEDKHARGVVINDFPGEWRRCAVCTLANPCSEHSALQQRCHQLAQLTTLLQSEGVRAAVEHAEATARSRQALLEQKQREEREAAEAEAQRKAAEEKRLAEEAAARAKRVYYQVQVISAAHLSSAAARPSWTCMKKLRASLDPRCELLMCNAGGLVSKPVQWTPTRHMTFAPSWGKSARWVRNSKAGWDLWRRLCCGGSTAGDTYRRLTGNTNSSTVSPNWVAADALVPDEEPTVDKRGLWYCPSAIRVLGSDDGGIPQKAVTVRLWDHNRGYRKKAHVDPQSDHASGWFARRYEKISDMLCGSARLELPGSWEELLSIQKAADDAVVAEEERLEREAIMKDPYAVEQRQKRPKVDPVEDDQRRRKSFRGGTLTVPLCDAEGPLTGDDGEPSTVTVYISLWSPPEPGRLWWQELAMWLYMPCMVLALFIGAIFTAMGIWVLLRPSRDCWEANLPSTADLFGEELSRCQLKALTATVEGSNEFVTLRWPAVYGAAGYRIQEWSWQQIQTGWYDARRQDDSFSFLYNYGGTELPSCGTSRLFPHSACNAGFCELVLTGRAELDVEWRYQAVKESTGEASRWSPPSNRMQLPPGLLSVPFDMAALSDPLWEPAPLALSNTCCPVGLYTAAADVGTERCTFCAAGQSSAGGARGATSCETCPAGHYADAGNALESSAAAAARFAEEEEGGGSDTADGLACTPCAFGTFASSAGSAVCESCSTGWFSFRGATSCWIWFPWPILASIAACAGILRHRQKRRRELGRKYLGAWINRTMKGPLSSRWRGDELGEKGQEASTAIVVHGRGTHATKAMDEAAEVGVRAASGLAKHSKQLEAQPGMDHKRAETAASPAEASTALTVLQSPCSVFEPDIPAPSQKYNAGELGPSKLNEEGDTDRLAEVASGPGGQQQASYRRFDERNVHQVYANGSEFAAHAPLWKPEQEKGVGTPRGKSGAGLLSAAAVQEELRQLLLRATAEAGDAWDEADREECRVNFELIVKDAESSETGVTRAQLGSSVTAVLERLPGSVHTLARAEPPSPATEEATTHGLAVVNVLPAPDGMEWMVEKQKAAKAKKEAAEVAARKARQAAEVLAKVDRHQTRQQAMAEAAVDDGRAGPMQLRASASWVKRVAGGLEEAEAAAAAAKEAARLAAEQEAARRAQEAAAAAAKAKADAEAEAARRAAQAEVPIRVAKLHTQLDEQRAVAARVARAAGSATAVGVIMTLETTASQASLPELGVRPHVRSAWGDSDDDGDDDTSSGGSSDSYTDTDDDDSYSSDEDVVGAAIASSLSGMRASRQLSQISEAL